MVKNLPAMQETRVRSLGGEDPLEKGTATYSSILAWKIPWTEKPAGSMGSQRVRHDRVTNTFTFRVRFSWLRGQEGPPTEPQMGLCRLSLCLSIGS